MEDLLASHAEQVHAVCRRLCRDPDDVQDATQDALFAIARGLADFDGRSALSTWIYRVTTNACLDELRRRRRRPVPIDDGARPEPASTEPSPAEQAVGAERRRAIRVALDALPEEFRVAVVLRDVADLEYGAISEILGVPIGTVRSRIARGRSRLATALAPAEPGTDPPPSASHPTEMT